MGQEAPTDVSRAVAAWGRAAHAIRLAGLPDKLRAVDVAVLLPLRRQGAAGRAAVGGVLPRHVTLSITAWHRTPERKSTHGGVTFITNGLRQSGVELSRGILLAAVWLYGPLALPQLHFTTCHFNHEGLTMP